MTHAGTPTRRRLSAAQRRERIEDAAVTAFADRGYDATTLGEIAAAADVARTVLYDHFPDKRSLFLHVLATQNDAMLQAVRDGITGSGDALGRMRATVAAYLRFTQEQPAARRLLVDPVPTGDEELDQVLRDHRDARSRAVTAALGPDLARAGVADTAEASVIVAVLIAGVDGAARWWAEHPEVALDTVVDPTVRLLWLGLPRLAQ